MVPKKQHSRRKNKLACKVSRAKELMKEARKQLQNAKRAGIGALGWVGGRGAMNIC